MNFARLNHILIPTTKTDRDRFRNARWGRAILFLFSWVLTLTEEGLGALLLWLFAAALAVNVGTTQFYYLWSGLTGLLAASVMWSRRYKLKQVSPSIQVPRRVSVGEPLTFQISLHNGGEASVQSIRMNLPFLPWDGTWTRRPLGFAGILAGRTARGEAAAVFQARGLHHLDLFSASAVLPLGLAHGPSVMGSCPKFWVVPRIAAVKTFAMPVAHRYQPGGVASASDSGESREVVGIRPYRPGDPLRDIHAASWARTGEPQVREFRQEYFTRIGVVVDTDRAGCTEETFEAALSLTAGILFHLSRGEALIDLLVFGDEMHPFTLGRHLGFLDQALDLLAEVTSGGGWSLETLESRVNPHLACLSSMIFVTLGRTEKHTAFEDFILSRNVGIRTVQVVDKKSDGSGSDPRCTVISRDDVEGAEIFL